MGDWNEARAHEVREHFQRRIYGRVPRLPPLNLIERRPLPSPRLGALGHAEHWRLELQTSDGPAHFALILISPPAPRAIVLGQLIQRGPAPLGRVAHALTTARDGPTGLSDRARRAILGAHITTPPFEAVLGSGFGLALFCPGDVVPDHAKLAPAILDRFFVDVPPEERGGALAVWAGLTSTVRAALNAATDLRESPVIAFGHSRHGKAALLAAAYDQAFAGVIAHQSGRFGASLTQDGTGETRAQIAGVYPHWFRPGFRAEAPADLDQHHLLALVAPRPILLGNARDDFWADPAGAFAAAKAASPAFLSHGVTGLAQHDIGAPDFSGGIACFSRDGWHGVNGVDWGHFVAFLQAKFGATSANDEPHLRPEPVRSAV